MGLAGAALDFELLRERRPEAIEAWFTTYERLVHAFVRRRVAVCPELAEDVTQETFLLALKRIEDFDPGRGAMLPWLTYLARNCARKALRDRAHVVGSVEAQCGSGSGAPPALDREPLPDELLLRDETLDRVHAALRTLSPPHQRVLESYYVLQQPLVQIACSESSTVAAVKSMLHRARLAFRDAFEGALEASTETATDTGTEPGDEATARRRLR